MSFTCFVLGASGGPCESNLSCYLIAEKENSDFITFDAGSLISGMKPLFAAHGKALAKKKIDSIEDLLQNHIKAYLISHCHLDHLLGMVIASQIDRPKPILGLTPTIEAISTHLFNDRIWPNFTDEGVKPYINVYHYLRLKEGETIAIPNTRFRLTAFPLYHTEKVLSTAFYVEAPSKKAVLYLGDTAFGHPQMNALWHKVAPQIRSQNLVAIFLECSYSDEQEGGTHLTPKLFSQSIQALASMVGGNLESLSIIVGHRKESFGQKSLFDTIQAQLESHPMAGAKLIFPRQADWLEL